MAARNAFSHHRLVSHCRGALLALCVAVAAPAAQAAANPSDWWVYVANDYPDEINELLARGADPNVRYRNGQPALMRAVVDGAWKVFDALAANPRTDVNAENPAGETPLMYLAIAGQVDRARSLMARGAQVNRLGWTPLHYAASKGQLAMARLLLDNKAMVNAPAPNGETPLMMAALSGNRAMVDLLLKAGADVTTRDTKGQDASDWATTGKSAKLAAELKTLIAQQEDAKRARRASAPPEPETPVPGAADGDVAGAAIPAATDATPAAPAQASSPAPAAQDASPKSAPSVGGVSGVRLNNYDRPAAP
ncbi:ankyrin repeat domain-containing protein [Achromobacter xylosoxidans]|uniref:ankyrin repeat domain-containing protein n=1 Tax=Alcaligenes xylosoxydans xylosoxydans TaxID=85698 RepID=UPI0006C545F9|nr:ankyrin repeat domain-containing protein [Achromobacter xylosoxidans]CUI45503.1 Ribulose-5-phosphate 4-epimerase and related epimerases and aldolases [Achromobacter xylosoxidans]